MMLLRIMFSFMKVCLLAFGGAYSAVPLVAREIVGTGVPVMLAEDVATV